MRERGEAVREERRPAGRPSVASGHRDTVKPLRKLRPSKLEQELFLPPSLRSLSHPVLVSACLRDAVRPSVQATNIIARNSYESVQ